MIASLVLWIIVSTVAAISGVTFFAPDVEQNGFLVRLFQ
jgi:hypothetical protein